MRKYLNLTINFIKQEKILVTIFFLALVVRLWGSRYGLPIIFNIDEPSFVRSVNGLRFSLNPNRFDWPHTHFYIHFVFYMAFYYIRAALQIVGLRPFFEHLFPLLWQDPPVFYFLSRVINAFLGALTIFPLYFASINLLKDKKLALMTVLLFSFIPFGVEDAHRALLDTGMTFWISLAFLYITKILDKPTSKNFLLTGVFLGLAFGTKYNAVFYFLVLAIAVLITFAKSNIKDSFLNYIRVSNIKKYLLTLFGFFSAWLITNPTVITDFDLFWSKQYGRGFLFQFENVGSKTWLEYPTSLYENLVTQSIGDYGITLYVVITLLVICFLFFNYRNKVNVLTLIVPILMYLYISKKDRNPSHYFIFLYPLIAVSVIKFLSDISVGFPKFLTDQKLVKKVNTKFASYLLYGLFVFTMISPILGSINHAYLFSKPDTRNIAYDYLQDNLTKDDLVYYYRGELEQLYSKPYDYKKLYRFERSNVDTSRLPFYLVIGVDDVSYDDLMVGDRDTDLIDGNVSRFINNSKLLLFVDNKHRLGPPVFIFKINDVEVSR